MKFKVALNIIIIAAALALLFYVNTNTPTTPRGDIQVQTTEIIDDIYSAATVTNVGSKNGTTTFVLKFAESDNSDAINLKEVFLSPTAKVYHCFVKNADGTINKGPSGSTAVPDVPVPLSLFLRNLKTPAGGYYYSIEKGTIVAIYQQCPQ